MPTPIPPHQQRVLDERTEVSTFLAALTERFEKLNAFINGNPIFGTLPEAERTRLSAQVEHMRATSITGSAYLALLDERIQAF